MNQNLDEETRQTVAFGLRTGGLLGAAREIARWWPLMAKVKLLSFLP